MTNGSLALRRMVPVLAACVGLGACSELGVNEWLYKRGPDGFRAIGDICYPLGNGGSTATGGGDSDFFVAGSAQGGMLSVEISSGESILATRRYDAAFARSGMKDELTVVTHKGDEYLLRFWGSDPCDETDVLGSPP
jgi:hypothetical protein